MPYPDPQNLFYLINNNVLVDFRSGEEAEVGL